MKKTIFIMICLTGLMIQQCAMFKISVSEKRNPVVQQLDLGENITLTTWGTITIGKTHFFPASFQLKTGDKVICLDPLEVDEAEKADYIFITHSHTDHCSIDDIRQLLKPETVIVCPKSVSKKLKGFKNTIKIVRPGDRLELNGMSCEAIAAYNTRPVFLWIKAHPESKENVGFVLTLDNGLRIYHAGDTDYIPEMQQLKNIRLALVPIGGDNLTMNSNEAARMINEIKPAEVVPMHFEIKDLEVLEHFKSLVDQEIKVIELQ